MGGSGRSNTLFQLFVNFVATQYLWWHSRALRQHSSYNSSSTLLQFNTLVALNCIEATLSSSYSSSTQYFANGFPLPVALNTLISQLDQTTLKLPSEALLQFKLHCKPLYFSSSSTISHFTPCAFHRKPHVFVSPQSIIELQVLFRPTQIFSL